MPSSFSQPANAAIDTVFSGLWIPLVTPFRDGAIAHPALAALTAKLAQQGVSGFVACGSTGEAAALDKSEQRACLLYTSPSPRDVEESRMPSSA